MANTKITELSLATSFNDTDLLPIVVDPSGSPITKKATIATFKVYAKGDTGATGAAGTNGTNGVGVPTGGTIHQALTKVDSDNYDTQWETIDKTFVGLGNVDNTSDATKNSASATLANKAITKRIVSAASYTTDTGTSLNCETTDVFIVTAQAGDLKFNNPSGTGTQGQPLIIRIKDDGTARALTYDTQFRAIGVTLPTTTVLSKTLYMGFIFNATDTKWDCIATAQEA